MAHTPTEQQQAAIDALVAGEKILKIEAVAGSGKTSTLCLMANAVKVPSLYLAFNKVTATEAAGKFPSHVTSKTTHSVAYAKHGVALNKKLSRPKGGYVNVAGTGSEIARFFKIDSYTDHETEVVFSAAHIGLMAKSAVARFEQSADAQLTDRHVSVKEITDKFRGHCNGVTTVKRLVFNLAKRLWAERIDLRSPVLATHDTYLKLFQLSNPVIEGYEIFYVDEFQDTTPCVMDIILQQAKHSRIVAVGDARQAIYCQPAGTLVKVAAKEGKYKRGQSVVYKEVPIENISVGDHVLSYEIPRSHLYKTGKKVSRVGSREYSGVLVSVDAGGSVSSYTPDHHVVVRLGDYNVGKHVVYLMKKGNKFRIGTVPWKYKGGMFGAAQRATAEKADAVWLLGVYDKPQDALLWENIYSYRYGIPQTCFKDRSEHSGQVSADDFWEVFGDNQDAGRKVLADFGLMYEAPLWGRKVNDGMCAVKMRSNFVTMACNLVDGMLCAVIDYDPSSIKSHGRLPMEHWKPIKVSRKEAQCLVYSLEVEGAHTYFGDNILTHNCWRGAVNALAMLDAKTCWLTKSFRYGQAVAGIATSVLQNSLVVEGHEGIPSVVGRFNVVDRTQSHTRLYRTNAALVLDAVEEIRRGTEIKIEADVRDFTKFLESAIALRSGNVKAVKHDSVLPFENWDEFKQEGEVSPDIARVAKMVESGQAEYVASVLASHVDSPCPLVTFVTAHKSKGREWEQVIVESDFKSALNKAGDFAMTTEEQNLLYVACTRAILKLEYNNTVEEILGLEDGTLDEDTTEGRPWNSAPVHGQVLGLQGDMAQFYLNQEMDAEAVEALNGDTPPWD